MKLPDDWSQKFGRQVLILQKNSPRLLFVAGVVGVVGTTILACRATLKLDKKLDNFKTDVDNVKANREHTVEVYGPRTYNKDMANVYFKHTVELARLYGPTILVGSASIIALTTSHVTLSRRNTSLMAAYSAITASFDAYREMVREEFGVEKELDIHQKARSQQLMGKKGDGHVLNTADPNKWSPYARFFDEGSPNWKKEPEYNRLFITCQQRYANNLLHARGHIFLNEVYDMLGLERSAAGQVVGWVTNQGGDNYVDFGMLETANSNFIEGWEPRVILDFNVDGPVWDKI